MEQQQRAQWSSKLGFLLAAAGSAVGLGNIWKFPGRAYEGGGGYAIDLQNGDQVYVDAGLCSVEGQFYDGCSAVVYYIDYPSGDNIYQVNIFGNQGLIIPPEPVPNDDYATGFDPDLDPMINGYETGFGF